MVEVNTYGIWQETDTGAKKQTEGVTIDIGWIEEDEEVYCFIEHGLAVTEFKEPNPDDPDKLIDTIMKRESHGEDIVDVLEDLGLEEIN